MRCRQRCWTPISRRWHGNPDGGAGGGARTRWTPEYLEANAPALGRALVEHGARSAGALRAFERAGIDPTLTLDEVLTPHLREQVLMAEGRERARPRYQKALDRAERHGYERLRERIENLVAAEAQQHARRGMRREGIGATAGDRPAPSPARSAVTPPLPMAGVTNPPVGIDYGRPAEFSPISTMPPSGLRNLPATVGGGGSVMGPMPGSRPMPPTLGGVENAPQRPIPSPAEMGFTPLQLPTAQGGAMPQSEAEARDLADQPNVYNFLLEASGMAPAGRSRQAFAEGRPLEGMGHAAMAAAPYVGGAVIGRAAEAVRNSPAVAGMLATAGGIGGLSG